MDYIVHYIVARGAWSLVRQAGVAGVALVVSLGVLMLYLRWEGRR